MGVRAEQRCAFRADRPIAESGAFGGAGNDADVLGMTVAFSELPAARAEQIRRQRTINLPAHSRALPARFEPNLVPNVPNPDKVMSL
jgi:hypothetical protein